MRGCDACFFFARYNKLGKIAQMLMDTDGAPPDEVKKALDQQIAELEAMRSGGGAGGAPPQAQQQKEGGKPPGEPEEPEGMRF